MKLTNEQLKAIENIEAATRYEAMEKVAEILNIKTGYGRGWEKAVKEIKVNEEIKADITYKKGKVVRISFYGIHNTSEVGIWYVYKLERHVWNFRDNSWDRR